MTGRKWHSVTVFCLVIIIIIIIIRGVYSALLHKNEQSHNEREKQKTTTINELAVNKC